MSAFTRKKYSLGLIGVALLLTALTTARAQAPAADSAQAWVNILSRHNGLPVFVDGREAGHTPLRNFAVPAGEHVFAVRQSLSASWLESDWQERVKLAGGDTLTLAPKFWMGYNLSSTPSGAQVWVEGQSLGTTPLVLRLPDFARARMTLTLENYQSARFEIDPDSLAAPEISRRHYHFNLIPQPSPLVLQTKDSDLYSSNGRHRKWGFIAAGVSLAAGIGAVWLKQEADEAYAAYLVTGAPAAREQYYDRAVQYDRYFGAAFGVSQVTFVFSVYSFLKAMR